MEQRPLRLGDILDDYCPRERRVTNHAVVAMIEDDVKQTRCTTCDAEHAYKGGQAPRRRKKEGQAALYKEVLAGMPETERPTLHASAPPPKAPEPEAPRDPPVERDEPAVVPEAPRPAAIPAQPLLEAEQAVPPSAEDGPVHRPLIRATLPRPEGQKDARPLPDFTIRQPGGRGNGNFRAQRGGGSSNGNRAYGGPRFGGGAGRRGRGGPQQPGGFRGGPQRQGGGKKRSR